MAMAPEQIGIGIRRYLSRAGEHPYDSVEWERRDARIPNYRDGGDAFYQPGVEFPRSWSQNATNIVAQKYFRGQLGTPAREWSLRQVIDRVVDTIAAWGDRDGYFADEEGGAFRDELRALILHQRAAFNSPVWFNIGVRGVPAQASACFILSVEDTMSSILNWYREEGTIFKGGSGAGVNLSRIRSSVELLAGGGTASGPVSFMRGADASAGTIKCLHRDTVLLTDRGARPIGEVQPGWKVLTRFGLRRVEARADTGLRPLVRVRTALGDELLCTPEHRFLVRGAEGEAWREAKDLRPDDYVALEMGQVPYGELVGLEVGGCEAGRRLPSVLGEPLALWLGWIVGQGRLVPTPEGGAIEVGAIEGRAIEVEVDHRDPELPARLEALTDALFGAGSTAGGGFAPAGGLPATDGEAESDGHPTVSCRIGPPRAVDFLATAGLWRDGSHFVPPALQASPAPVRAAFLAGLFESEGYVLGGRPVVWVRSRSLALGVHRLLLSLGIPSSVSSSPVGLPPAGGEEASHQVRVLSAEGLRRFAKSVGFMSERKSRLLEEAVAEEPSRFETHWFFPHSQAELGAGVVADAALRQALAGHAADGHRYALSLARAAELADAHPGALPPALARFAAGEELYVPVTVERAGSGPTADLTVAGVHEYLVQGIVTHNSGGKTRRAAKMVILNADHPDVQSFIWCKAIEERKARALAAAGFDMDLDGRDSHSTQYQNANNSVRVTDEFMRAVVEDRDWALRAVTTGEVVRSLPARGLLREISEAAWECADPGMQFDTTINRWHTAPNTGRINGSNPCSEYMHLDNSACNLASLNLLGFLDPAGRFDVEGFEAAVTVLVTAQEILVGNADYPTEAIGDTSRRFRQLGLGYANLGASLMALGFPYDSDEGRAWAGAVTALMSGRAYATSSRIAGRVGPFAGFEENREPMIGVLRAHRQALSGIDAGQAPSEVLDAASGAWAEAVELGDHQGVRNSQISVLAPTGCLEGGSLVVTDRGLVRLGSLGDPMGSRWQELEAVVATDEGPRAASRFFVNGLEPVVTVSTAHGYRLRGTPAHRVKVVDATGAWAWRRLSDLRPGDLVPLARGGLVGGPRSVPLPGPVRSRRAAPSPAPHGAHLPREMSVELAELSGYVAGAGGCTEGELRLSVAREDFEVAEHLARSGKRLFGLEARLTDVGGRLEVAFAWPEIADWWVACRLAPDGRLPDAVLRTNDPEVYRGFVRGLFEAAGTVVAGVPCWTGASPELGREVQSLLLALGFAAAGGAGVLRLLDCSMAGRYAEEIGFISGRKQAALGHTLGRGGAGVDRIPLTHDLVDRLAPNRGERRNSLLVALRAQGSIPRPLGEALARCTGDSELERALGFFYDRVSAVEEGGEELTYDLSVPANLTYVANGFVSHNTIGLMMDCDTTGVEPDLALTKAKKLVGGGTMLIVNQTVPRALRRLGYSDVQVESIVAHLDEHKGISGAPGLRPEHLAVFACAMGDNPIHYLGHVRMMAAVQPFISGAISKTINMPEEATVEEIEDLHIAAWHLGIKAIAIYRDNCKVGQPLSSQEKAGNGTQAIPSPPAAPEAPTGPVRDRLPRKRASKTFSFRVADCHGYVTVGEYGDGRPGEIFLKVAKQGSTLAGIMDAFAISVSHGLQYGVPLRAFVEMFINMRFEPAGITDDPDIRLAASLVDYIFRRLAVEYLPEEERLDLGILTVDERVQPTLPGVEEAAARRSASIDLSATDRPSRRPTRSLSAAPTAPATRGANGAGGQPAARRLDAPYCYQCGMEMQRAGSCYVCTSCGSTSGCS